MCSRTKLGDSKIAQFGQTGKNTKNKFDDFPKNFSELVKEIGKIIVVCPLEISNNFMLFNLWKLTKVLGLKIQLQFLVFCVNVWLRQFLNSFAWFFLLQNVTPTIRTTSYGWFWFVPNELFLQPKQLSHWRLFCNQNSCPIEGCTSTKTVVSLKAVLHLRQLSHWGLYFNQNSCPIEGCNTSKTVVPLKAVLQPKQLSHWRLFCNQNSCPFEGCTSIKTVIWSYERIPVSQKSKQLYLLFKVVIKPKILYCPIKGVLQLRQLSYWMCPTSKTCPFWGSP